jgi:hypothetical protein
VKGSKMTGLVPVVKILRAISWQWTKARMKQTASDLGLVDPTTGSNEWIGYPSPSPDFPARDAEYPGELLDHPYGFSFQGEEVSHFHIYLGAVDMGEVYLYESDRYNEICERKHAEFKAAFQKAAKRISTVLGKPTFQGRPDDTGSTEAHPIGWSGELAAVWRLNNARLILVYGQEDKELPIVLDLYVCPPLKGSSTSSATVSQKLSEPLPKGSE